MTPAEFIPAPAGWWITTASYLPPDADDDAESEVEHQPFIGWNDTNDPLIVNGGAIIAADHEIGSEYVDYGWHVWHPDARSVGGDGEERRTDFAVAAELATDMARRRYTHAQQQRARRVERASRTP